MATYHKEIPEVVDGICVDCEYIYECAIKEAAEDRDNHVVECSRFKKDVVGVKDGKRL